MSLHHHPSHGRKGEDSRLGDYAGWSKLLCDVKRRRSPRVVEPVLSSSLITAIAVSIIARPSPLVICPTDFCRFKIVLLALLDPSCQQDHQYLVIASEIATSKFDPTIRTQAACERSV
jgi:hypothetical protein